MRDRYRSRLSAQYHLDSEYLSVSQIARILGLSPSAIHADMRSGRFFLPYRLFDSAPKIFIDDLVEWHYSEHGAVPAFGMQPLREASKLREDAIDAKCAGLTQAEISVAMDWAPDNASR